MKSYYLFSRKTLINPNYALVGNDTQKANAINNMTQNNLSSTSLTAHSVAQAADL